MVNPEEVLTAQAEASRGSLAVFTAIMFYHKMAEQGSLAYSGLVLPEHVNSTSGLLPLTEDEGSWFVAITPMGFGLGILLSIPISEHLGRKKTFLVSNFLCLIGIISMYLAPSFLVLVPARAH